MPIVPMTALLDDAMRRGYGVGYFEAWDGYSLEAVREAAEEERAPVILGFGCMMADRGWLDSGGLEALAGMGRPVAERAAVPVSFLLNETQTFEQAARALDLGFNAVMPDTSTLPSGEARAAVARLARLAHERGATVEAEIGCLPEAGEGHGPAGEITDPDEAAAFVAATGVDCLAVSIGNVHLLTDGTASVDLARLEAVHRRVSVPLVIHGGTGYPPEAVPTSIASGAVKFNVGTVLKQAFLQGVREAMDGWPARVNVHDVLGSHKPADVLNAGKVVMKTKVKEFMRLYGSSGQADVGGA